MNSKIKIPNYLLFRFIGKIYNYENGLISKIKFFLHPRVDEYRFKVEEIIKYIYYEMSYHSHIDNYNKYMNHNTYCECYFNRKHRKLNDLKKHKCVKLMKILELDYDSDNFKKKYKCSYGYNYNYICYKYEDEICKLSD